MLRFSCALSKKKYNKKNIIARFAFAIIKAQMIHFFIASGKMLFEKMKS